MSTDRDGTNEGKREENRDERLRNRTLIFDSRLYIFSSISLSLLYSQYLIDICQCDA